jgi:putative membrane protein insertion efficiency factor
MIRAFNSALAWLVLLPVHTCRAVPSPLKRAPSCRFLPTCSEHAITAVKQRGVFVGGALAAWRISRCNPLCRSGYDPVPAPGAPLPGALMQGQGKRLLLAWILIPIPGPLWNRFSARTWATADVKAHARFELPDDRVEERTYARRVAAADSCTGWSSLPATWFPAL